MHQTNLDKSFVFWLFGIFKLSRADASNTRIFYGQWSSQRQPVIVVVKKSIGLRYTYKHFPFCKGFTEAVLIRAKLFKSIFTNSGFDMAIHICARQFTSNVKLRQFFPFFNVKQKNKGQWLHFDPEKIILAKNVIFYASRSKMENLERILIDLRWLHVGISHLTKKILGISWITRIKIPGISQFQIRSKLLKSKIYIKE